jgi:hypothetical protein
VLADINPLPGTARPTYSRAAWLFRRLLGAVYLFAFWSLATQIVGLVGHDGILPATDYMNEARAWAVQGDVGLDRFRVLPTLCWMGTSDTFLTGLCIAGAVLAALLAAGIAPALALPLLWIGYLSIATVGQDFLGYQWDTLLLEAGFLAIFTAPAHWRDRLSDAEDPHPAIRWLLWWLIVRLMVGSGAVKLASGDPAWHNLTALAYHYETQPIPTPLAWYAHQLPLWFQKLAAASVIGVELIAPALIVLHRTARHVSCAMLAGLQVLIAATGNYAFFNLLSLALVLLLLDDRVLSRGTLPAPTSARRIRLLTVGAVVLACLTVPASVLQFGRSLGVDLAALPIIGDSARLVAPLRSVNSYGLFAVMTTTRPEIVVEGSEDGVSWKAYSFRAKPGDPQRRPPWVAPFQPRLDWQMWFAALGTFEGEPWFPAFMARLLEGSPDVLALLAHDPFAGTPPRYLRAVLYRYRFTDLPAGRSTGMWWTSERLGEYSPVMSRQAGGD